MDDQDGRDGFPFEHWQFDGDTLTISADNSNETLTPGQPLSLSIHARGQTTSPTACTFNGAAPITRALLRPMRRRLLRRLPPDACAVVSTFPLGAQILELTPCCSRTDGLLNGWA